MRKHKNTGRKKKVKAGGVKKELLLKEILTRGRFVRLSHILFFTSLQIH